MTKNLDPVITATSTEINNALRFKEISKDKAQIQEKLSAVRKKVKTN